MKIMILNNIEYDAAYFNSLFMKNIRRNLVYSI